MSPELFENDFADLISRMLGESALNLAKILTRICICDKQSLSALPMSDNKHDLTAALSKLGFEGSPLVTASPQDTLSQYDRVCRACRVDVPHVAVGPAVRGMVRV